MYVARVTIRRNALSAVFASLAFVGLLAASRFANSGARFAGTLGFEIFLGMLALAFAARSRLGIRARLGLGPSALSPLALVLLALGTLALSYSLDGFYRLLEPPDRGVLFQFESELLGLRGRALALALLTFALVPGIAEELLCRGWAQRGLEARCGPFWAIVLASAFFGALHGDPVHSLLAAVLGLYLGAIAQLAGSVRASIACHVANNTAAVVGAASALGIEPPPPDRLLLAATFSLGVLGWIWRRHRTATPPGGPQKEGPQGLQNRPGSDDP